LTVDAVLFTFAGTSDFVSASCADEVAERCWLPDKPIEQVRSEQFGWC